ncbi:MAG: aconitase family protein, partial [Dethiobacteria bacterium]
MSMTMGEKILAFHSGKEVVKPGEFIMVKPDLVFGNDGTAPLAIEVFSKFIKQEIFDKDKIVFIADHFTPNASIKAAEQCKIIRQFAKRFDIKNFFDTGRAGIEHCLLPEQGFVMPGDLILGADSHTCTYGALGAFSTGIGSTDLAVAMKQGEVWMRVPETIKVQLTGNGFQDWVSGKDIILFLISKIGVEGARYKVLEFDGDALPYLSI